MRHVTDNSEAERLERNPFPELHRPPTDVEPDHDQPSDARSRAKQMAGNAKNSFPAEIGHLGRQRSDVELYKKNEEVKQEVKTGQAEKIPRTPGAIEEQEGDVETQRVSIDLRAKAALLTII